MATRTYDKVLEFSVAYLHKDKKNYVFTHKFYREDCYGDGKFYW